MFSIISGSNPLSKLEVVSLLNIPSQAHEMYYYNTVSCPAKYNPKVYLGTTQTIAIQWNFDRQKGINHPSNWPQSYQQGSQKGEAIKIEWYKYECSAITKSINNNHIIKNIMFYIY